MNPNDVKLPLKTKLKYMLEAFFHDENSFPAIAIALLLLFCMFLAWSTPLFMTNGFANFMLFLMLTGVYGFLIFAGVAGICMFYEEQFIDWFNTVKTRYDEQTLPERKRILESVDDILLKDGGNNEAK
jgi:hypothetical protein